MDKVERYELRMRWTLIVAVCVAVLSIAFQMSGEVVGKLGFLNVRFGTTTEPFGMSGVVIASTIAMYTFANGAIKALKQENESLQSGDAVD